MNFLTNSEIIGRILDDFSEVKRSASRKLRHLRLERHADVAQANTLREKSSSRSWRDLEKHLKQNQNQIQSRQKAACIMHEKEAKWVWSMLEVRKWASKISSISLVVQPARSSRFNLSVEGFFAISSSPEWRLLSDKLTFQAMLLQFIPSIIFESHRPRAMPLRLTSQTELHTWNRYWKLGVLMSEGI